MFAQITIKDDVHDFTEGAFTSNSNMSVSVSQQLPPSACMKGNVQDSAGQGDACSLAFSKSICSDECSKQMLGDGENIMGVHKFLEPCVPHDNKNINPSDLSEVSKPSVLLDDGWKVTNEVVDATQTGMATTSSKLVQDIQIKRPSRSRKKREDKKVVLSVGYLQFTRRKRSKRVRSTTWGVLGNFAPALKQKGGTKATPEMLKRSKSANGIQGSRKHDNRMTVRNAEKLKETRRLLSGPICLKVKFGKDSIMDIITKVEDKNGIQKVTYEKTLKDAPVLLEKRKSESIKTKLLDENSGNASNMDIIVKDTMGNLCSSTRCEFPFQANVDNIAAATDSSVLDSGTSPDSEIINTVPDLQVSGKEAVDLHDTMHSPIEDCASPNIYTSKEVKKDVLCQMSGFCPKGEMPSLGSLNNVGEFATLGRKGNNVDNFYSNGASTLATVGIASLKASDSGNCSQHDKEEAYVSQGVDSHIDSLYPLMAEKSLPCSKDEKDLSRKASKSRIEMADSHGREENVSTKKVNCNKTGRKCIDKEKGDRDQIFHEVEKYAEKGLRATCDIGKAGEIGKEYKIGDPSKMDRIPGVVTGESMKPRNAWVSCDDCHKWRRIPALLADEIEESNCRWVCKDNMDRRYADCLIPQEKSNEEINAELEISDGEEELHKASGKKSLVTENSSYTAIRSNLFLNRRRKSQTIDEIMVCSCKQPADGRVGCGHKCLNRMLNIECISGMCPCGEFCSNQQFQKRKYAKLKSMRCGKKGFGLHLLEDVSEGKFLIEYVGEVLDMHAYEARQKEYAANGHRHFYFMTLNGSEVIDACAKGNLGRFINHSCEPNCRTEKWMVNGEVCVGIFSVRDIKKGEELTFDYNYVRVFGAAAKKCVCGSSQCRGYIGGDPLNSDTIVQADSDDEYFEPFIAHDIVVADKAAIVVIDKALSAIVPTSAPKEEITEVVRAVSKKTDNMDESLSTNEQADISSEETKEMFIHGKVEIESSSTAVEITKESRTFIETSFSTVFTPKKSSENECSGPQVSLIQPEENSSPENDEISIDTYTVSEECSGTEKTNDRSSLHSGKSLSDTTEKFVKSKSDDSDEGGIAISKLHTSTKVSDRLSKDKKKKPKTGIATEKKTVEIHNKSSSVVPVNPKLPLTGPSNGRFEAVQVKLNVLLDSNGGISKRKDASRGYLKLLLLTAASEDSGNGQGIQSNRDLSMILDALLKTKSRSVLVDVINKNGLQMLHNIMKRCRKEHKKIPILRKVLKVLEYLATREILTSEYINGGPRRPGMESFKDSILGLSEHSDKQVHQSARNFRDRWIPRCFRKYGNMERFDTRTESHSEPPNNDRFSAQRYPSSDPATNPPDTSNTSTKCEPEIIIPEASTESRFKRRRKSRWDQPGGIIDTAMADDVPPGFSSPLKDPVSNNNPQPEVATGYSQPRFNSRIPVAYGVPVLAVQQFGVQNPEPRSGSWIVSPGIPFRAFPPLPPYPRDHPMNQSVSMSEQDHHTTNDTAPGNQMDFQHFRGDCNNNTNNNNNNKNNNLSGRFFRQMKPKNPKLPPPWVRNRSNWGPPVMNHNGPRNGTYHQDFGNAVPPPPHNGNSFNHQYAPPPLLPPHQQPPQPLPQLPSWS